MITLQNIADKAEVSKGTVSYVLSGKHRKAKISEETCERIKGIAREMGYRTNTLARALATGHSKVIGFVAGSTKTEFIRNIIDGIHSALEPDGYLLKLLSLPHDPEEADCERLLHTMLEQRLPALICHSLKKEALLRFQPKLAEHAIPFGIVSNSFLPKGAMHVGSNDAKGVALAVEHLAEMGHRRIAYVGVTSDAPPSVVRLKGFRQGMATVGLPVPDAYLIGGRRPADTRVRALELLRSADAPTAFVCNGDPLALGLMTHLSHEGFRAPEDVSIVGFGNFSFGPDTVPSLTTVYEPFEEMGRAIAEVMLAASEAAPHERPGVVRETIDTHLVVRESTGPPRELETRPQRIAPSK